MKFSEMKYERPDIEAFKAQVLALVEEQRQAKSGEEQLEIHKKWYALSEDFETAYVICHVRHDMDNTDEFYDKENDFFDEVLPEVSELKNQYYKVLYDSPYRDVLEAKLGPVTFKNIELDLKSMDASIMELKQQENALVSKYVKLIATAEIEFEGETYNLSLLTPKATDKDRKVREAAEKAISDWFMSKAEEIDDIYDQLVKNRTAQAKALGFETFTELGYCRMHRNSYGRAEVENFRKQIKESFVPFVGKLCERRSKRLELDKLQTADMGIYFKEGNPKPVGNDSKILEAGQRMYEQLSPLTKEFFDFMMENELFEVLGRKTKTAGGYQTYLSKYKSPFIYANFNGSSGDVDVITHECGHGFQCYLTREDENPEHNEIGMETAEIHSMSMEYFTYDWMEQFFGEGFKDYLTMHLEDSCVFLPYGTMVDEFQHIVYDNPDMTPAERNECWKKLEEQYRPYFDFSDSEYNSTGRTWQKKSHIFCVPFYYIDYVLASCVAMQFKVLMDENREEAWDKYVKLCKLSASDYYTNMLKTVGLKLPFEDGCVAEIVEKLSKKQGL
ncbi:MAG: M3 family oligoendopeptidase [Pseudobutyrivibrio sp.]|nr:M3 family oligoendopeptidase [Pseudobutyrivibrio sp.]